MSDFNELELSSLNGKKEYQTQWNQMQAAWVSNRMPQSMLFVGSFDYAFMDFVKKLTQLVFCKKNENEPCFECADCRMVAHGEHPDVEWVKPEKSSGPIKIDQIRELQNDAYLTPQRSTHRFIVIESADRMNTAAANSLLKILEEPAPQTIFLLLAQQLSTLLPTILSRCQIIRFASHYDLSVINLLQLAEHYSPESEQVMIMKQSEFILDGLIAVIEQKEHPSVIAAQWSQFEFGALLWFLYLVYAQIQTMQINRSAAAGPAIHQLNHLMSLLNPIIIYSQIDKLNTLQRRLSHNMNVNQILALEDLLLGLYSESKAS
ncbi:DNA polymerase III subunit [Legionella bozemanae]|uniref:DNA-directed DNA polymerase n=1 Tax=Legionella bozemanae TaxID=447 RepID=A0A0W0RR16_LEGBO|nr:DNA polymerase III subunit [Legionella bozemanae]KTC73511.1 DNA polymerase III, delta' subunit [Legionella bozemanae]STO34178.1 DNA polymerase III subunit delta' [Legionella bozemanae]